MNMDVNKVALFLKIALENILCIWSQNVCLTLKDIYRIMLSSQQVHFNIHAVQQDSTVHLLTWVFLSMLWLTLKQFRSNAGLSIVSHDPSGDELGYRSKPLRRGGKPETCLGVGLRVSSVRAGGEGLPLLRTEWKTSYSNSVLPERSRRQHSDKLLLNHSQRLCCPVLPDQK